MTGPSRRSVVTAGSLLACGSASATFAVDRPDSFAMADAAADPAALLAFIAANDQRIVTLDVTLPWHPVRTGIRHVHLRGGQFLVVIDGRGWWTRAAMFWTGGERGADAGSVTVRGTFAISTNRAFKGPGFNQVEGLPRWLYTGYHVDPFA